jgi:Ca-activated chloride channel family protein
MVLVSDGEDLEGDVEEAVRRAKEAGVVVHAVAVGTEGGQPVPDVDAEGRVVGYKRDESGSAVVSRLNMATLEEVARGTGGRAFRITPADTSLSALAAAIEGMEQKTLAREYSYRRKERFQVPLAVGLAVVTVGLLLPPPPLRRKRRGVPVEVGRKAAVLLLAAMASSPAWAQAPPTPASPPSSPASEPTRRSGTVLDELLLRPRRATEEGRAEYGRGSHPQALSAFERATAARPQDPAVRFNLADGLYKNGKYEEAAALFQALGADPASPVAAPSRYNLGNSLYQKQDYRGAVQAYRDALRLAPRDEDVRKNMELALRALKEQEEQQKRQQQEQKGEKQDEKDRKKQQNQQQKDQQDQKQQQQGQQQKGQQPQPRPQTPEERQAERFRKEAGMPQERAMQLLDALQQNEKAEQRRLLALKRAQKKKGKDW